MPTTRGAELPNATMAASAFAACRVPATGDLLALQRLAGNGAVTSALMVQRDGPPGSAGGQVDAAVGGSTSGQQLSASATIGGGQQLSATGGKIIHTKTDTIVRVSVSQGGLSIDFSPSLTVTKEDAIAWIDVDVDVHRLTWDFGTQMLRAEWTAANIVNWLGDPGHELLAAFEGALNALPARTAAPGYDPFTDPDLPADLSALVGRLATAGGPATSLPRMSNIQVEGGFTFGAELSRDVGHGILLVVPAGTRLTATVSLAGGAPASPSAIRISEIRLSTEGGKPTLNLRALGQDWPVIMLSTVTVTAGGHVSADYRIIHEDIGTGLLQLLAAAVVQENPAAAGEIRDDLTVRDEAAHQLIDRMVRDNVEPALRDGVLANSGAIPGLNLAEALGISP